MQKEAAYAQATLDAAQRVNQNQRPFYFLHVASSPDTWPDVPIWYPNKAKGTAIASIIGCTDDWFGNWTGYDAGNPDLFITADLQGGRLPQVLARELPCVLVGHWPGFYFGGEEIGFQVLKEVNRRLDSYDPAGTRTRWMKTSAIGHYWMARTLSDIKSTAGEAGTWRIAINTRFPTADFTLTAAMPCHQVQVNGQTLRQVYTQRDFQAGTFLVEGTRTAMAFTLPVGETGVDLFPSP